MEDDFDDNVIKNTQLSLGKYVKRPPLSDKLLKKPPFRFLHDIVTSVLKSKGFFEGLFEENELNSENVKDRDSKISFLNKVITVVSLTTGKPLTVKPSKIVAGQEPAKTNELLQLLAQALDNNLSSDEAVQQFKSGAKISPSNDKKHKESVKVLKKNTESKKPTSRTSGKLVESDKVGQPHNKLKPKDITVHKKELPPKKSSKTSNKKPSEKSNLEGKKSGQKIVDNLPEHNQQELVLNEDTVVLDQESSLNEKVVLQDTKLQKDFSNGATSNFEEQLVLGVSENSVKPSSANQFTNEVPDRFEIKKDVDIIGGHSLISNKSVIEGGIEETKYQSTHQSINEEIKNESNHNLDIGDREVFQVELEQSNKLSIANNLTKKDLNSSSTITPSVRPSSSRPGAPRIRVKSDNEAENILVGKVNIISENVLNEEDEDTSIIIESNTIEESHESLPNQGQNHLINQNSHLVQQILNSQKEFSQTSGKTEIEWQIGVKKAPDMFIQEMEQLKFYVQALSRIANPLGKLLDHIQEDVEVMRQELQQWTKLYEETSKDLLFQKNATNEALLPFNTKLKQLTSDMKERHEKIIDLKISIYKNDSRIEKLLSNSNVQ